MTNLTMLIRNRHALTFQALESLTINTPKDAIRIMLLDDRSDEPTRALVKTCEGERNDTPMGTGPLRNAVVWLSEHRYGRGDYLYLSDNDVYFMPSWLPNLIKAYEYAWGHGYRVIGGYNHPYHQPTSFLPINRGKWPLSNVMEVNALATQSMLMKWEVFDKYGPFCDTPIDKVCQSEDHAFCQKIREDGFKVGVVSPVLVVNCGITNTMGEHIPGWEMVKAQAPAGVIVE